MNIIVEKYLNDTEVAPLLMAGNSYQELKDFPAKSVNCVITSPPYWQKREYENGGIGLENTPSAFIAQILAYTKEIHRILKNDGSFWLNIGDSYRDKNLMGILWRIAIQMMDEQGWILRNEVIWNKVKGGMDNSKDKLGNNHEPFFHFVKQKYYYDVDAIRLNPKTTKVVNGAVVSSTGVTGIKYKRQIELSTILSEEQKQNAFKALNQMLSDMEAGKVADFRMVINKQTADNALEFCKVIRRAKELEEKGFYFLKYNPKGSKPTDVWDILPEDTQRKSSQHSAPYPEDLVRIPILATCPPDGIVLDPFAGTGTTNLVAYQSNRKSIGIDISKEYIMEAKERANILV